VGIITLPGSLGRVAIAVFVMNGGGAATMQKVISDVGAAVYESFTGQLLPPSARAATGRRAARPVKKRS
jgi:hypothetical protein